MRVAVISPYDKHKIESIVKSRGFKLSKNPEIVFTYGGDGTMLRAETKYPGIPIVPVRKSRICSNCHVYSVDYLPGTLEKIKKGKFHVIEKEKVEVLFKGKRVSALNEIQLRSKDPRTALRFSVKTKGKKLNEIIGDGLVAATSYGSTGYYRSIGYEPFGSGIRLGFNNVQPKLPSIKIEKCEIKNLRKDAWLAADNFFLDTMKSGDKITIKKSRKKARFVVA